MKRITVAKLVILIAFLFIIFRATLEIYFGILSFLILPFIFFVCMVLISSYLLGKSIPKDYILMLGYFIYLVFVGIIFSAVTVHYNVNAPVVGIVNLSLMALFWTILCIHNRASLKILINYYNKLVIFFGVFNAIGGIIQFYVSPTLFGLVSHIVYTDELNLVNPVVAKRAISFISSPQALSIFLSLVLISIIYYPFKNIFLKFICFFIVLFASILTGSKAFFIFLLFFFFAKLVLDKSLLAGAVLMVPFAILPFVLINVETVFRMFDILHIVLDISASLRFLIWKDFLFFDTNFVQFLFGHGLGVISRGAQLIGKYQILNGSAESFLIHLYFETGIIGIFLFLFIYFKAIKNFLSHREYRFLGLILFAFLGNLLFTPSFYAFNTGFYYWAVIVFGIGIGSRRLRKVIIDPNERELKTESKLA